MDSAKSIYKVDSNSIISIYAVDIEQLIVGNKLVTILIFKKSKFYVLIFRISKYAF